MKQLLSAEFLPVSHKTSVSRTVFDSRSFLNITALSLPLSLPKYSQHPDLAFVPQGNSAHLTVYLIGTGKGQSHIM
jgi:hypothetical protein